jgi:phosphopantothenate synthetase
MTKQQNDQLATEVAIIKNNQNNMKETVAEMKEIQKEQSEDIKAILERLDNLTGGKTALMWITGLFVSLVALGIAYLNSIKH